MLKNDGDWSLVKRDSGYLLCAAASHAPTYRSLYHFKRSSLGMELLEMILLKFCTVLEPWPVPSAQVRAQDSNNDKLVFH